MYFTAYYLQKPDGTIDRNIFAYNIYMKAMQKYREITANYKYVPSDYFRCFVLDDEGDCLSNNLDD